MVPINYSIKKLASIVIVSAIFMFCTSALSAQNWDLTLVNPLQPGQSNATEGSGIAIDSNGSPHIFDYHDSHLWYHYLADGLWQHIAVAAATDGGGLNSGPAVCIDSQNILHVAYLTSDWYLGYAWYDGVWHFEILDQAYISTSWIEIAIDDIGSLHIAYAASGLKYAHKVGNAWVIQQLTTSGSSYVTGIVTDSQNYPHIISWGSSFSSPLVYRFFDGAQWQVEPLTIEGTYSSFILDSLNRPQISYYFNNGTQYSLWFMTKDTGVWVQTLVDPGVQQDKRGWDTHIVYGPDGNLHIAYYCHNAGLIKHAWYENMTWQTEVIDNVGIWQSSIDFETHNNKLYMTYMDIDEGTFWLATKQYNVYSPENLTVQVSNVNDVLLDWDSPIPNPDFILTAYQVYQDGVFAATIDTTATEFVIAGLSGGLHTFYVTAMFGQTESEQSNHVDAEIDLRPPTELTAVLSGSEVTCSWFSPPTTNVSLYKVYRNNVFIGQTADTGYLDILPQIGSYTYKTSAVYNESYESDYSNTATVALTSNSDPEYESLSTIVTRVYPNPFHNDTSISFSLKQQGFITIDIYNLKGGKVQTLVNGIMNTGIHQVNWNGKDFNNQSVSSGIYFLRMKSGSFSAVSRLLLLR